MNCGDCAIEEGQYHELGCDQERCKKCTRQLVSCGCNLFDPEVEWEMKDEDREIYFFNGWLHCVRCAKEFPQFFMVDDKEWKRICGATYDRKDILCKVCYNFIKNKRGNKK